MNFSILLLSLMAAIFSKVYSYDDYADGYGGGGGGGDPYGGGGGGGDPYADRFGEGGGGGSTTPIVTKATSVEEVDKLIKDFPEHPVIVGYFEADDNDDYEVFNEVAQKMGMAYKFASIADKDILKSLKYTGTTLFVHRPSKDLDTKLEKPKSRYPSKNLSSATLLKFIYDKSVPTLGEVKYASETYYDKVKSPVVMVYGDFNREKNIASYNYILNRIKKVAAKHVGKIVFGISNKKDYSTTLNSYNFNKDSLKKSGEVVVGLRVQDTYYSMTQPFTSDNVDKFLEDYKKGVLVGKLKKAKKEPAGGAGEEDDSDSKVVTITNDNFKELITDETSKDILLEFYAPWCGHCKALKPEYKELAENMKDDSTVLIAAMDADAHKPPADYKVEGFPTIFYIPKNTKIPESYQGERTAAAMQDFLISKQK